MWKNRHFPTSIRRKSPVLWTTAALSASVRRIWSVLWLTLALALVVTVAWVSTPGDLAQSAAARQRSVASLCQNFGDGRTIGDFGDVGQPALAGWMRELPASAPGDIRPDLETAAAIYQQVVDDGVDATDDADLHRLGRAVVRVRDWLSTHCAPA